MPKKNQMAVKNKNKAAVDLSLPKASKNTIRIFLLVVVAAVIIFLMNRSSQLWKDIWPVKHVMLQGDTQYLVEADIIEFINQFPVKGMLSIDLETMQKSAKKIDWIKTVEIRKVWPETLIFNVTEHQPVAKIGDYILTQQGTRIKKDERIELFASLPKIIMDFEGDVETNEYINIWRDFKQIKRQFELLSLELANLRVDRVKNWHLEFINGLRMNLGRKNHIQRVDRLVKVYSTIENKQYIRSIDLRYHNGVAVEWTEKNV